MAAVWIRGLLASLVSVLAVSVLGAAPSVSTAPTTGQGVQFSRAAAAGARCLPDAVGFRPRLHPGL